MTTSSSSVGTRCGRWPCSRPWPTSSGSSCASPTSWPRRPHAGCRSWGAGTERCGRVERGAGHVGGVGRRGHRAGRRRARARGRWCSSPRTPASSSLVDYRVRPPARPPPRGRATGDHVHPAGPHRERDVPLDTVPALARHYRERLRAAVPGGPVVIGGHSLGGSVALEMARLIDGELTDGEPIDGEPIGGNGAVGPAWSSRW